MPTIWRCSLWCMTSMIGDIPTRMPKRHYPVGNAGDVPDTQTLTPTVPPAALMKLRDEMVARENLIRELTSERDRERGKVEQLEKLLKEQIADKDKQIRQLLEELAEMRAARKYKVDD